ncbi:unnamed protein product [Effrenium voratum]|uniref:SnoaL-like domain-containing protein n=1 Tax=Effrenium voratum TaxID=2562239 RepID=A0AA36HVS3_9DINO|nr:unnamed protein product [Effrenium voratum]
MPSTMPSKPYVSSHATAHFAAVAFLFVLSFDSIVVDAVGVKLTAHQQMLSDLWDEHCRYEFDPAHKSTEKTMATMVAEPYVNHIPTMVGGIGKESLSNFYETQFIFTNPDMTLVPVSRTVGADSLVDELIIKMVHDKPVPWLLPGVEPTGRPLEFALLAVVHFEPEEIEPGAEVKWKLRHEHIYWDQASVLVQAGLLNQQGLPVTGVEATRKVVDPHSEPSNLLLGKRHHGQSKGVFTSLLDHIKEALKSTPESTDKDL